MPRVRQKAREQARVLFLSGELASNAAIAKRLHVKPHSVAAWRREEGWDALRLKADRRAAEKLVEQLATERAELNAKHYKLWEALLGRAVAMLRDDSRHTIKGLEQISNVLSRAQQGQRLAKEIATVAEAEERARLEALADVRSFVDLFITSVKEHVTDEATRDRLREAILARLPQEPSERTREPGDESLQ
jgi:Rad3-related DNA helicase